MTTTDQSLVETPQTQPNYSVVHVEHSGHSITPVVFNGKNYDEWSRSFHLALIAKGKLGYINGSIPKQAPNSDKLESWTAANALVTMWIFNTIAPGLRKQISLRPEAKQVWVDLKNRFSQSNEARIYQLQAELMGCRQGPTESLMDYCGRMTAIWDEILEYDTIPSCSCNPCSCDWMNIINSRREKKRVRDFLMGLDDRFSNSRSQLISLTPPPTLDLVYNRLLQDEGVRNLSYPKPESVPDTVAFAARVHHGSKASGGGGRDNHPIFESPVFSTAPASSNNSNRPFCIACHRPGHSFRKCYRVTGEFPDWWGNRPRDRIYINPSDTDLNNARFVPDVKGRDGWERSKQKSAGTTPRVHMAAGSGPSSSGGMSGSTPPLPNFDTLDFNSMTPQQLEEITTMWRARHQTPATEQISGGLRMGFRGQPSMSNPPIFDNSQMSGDPRRMTGHVNGYGAVPDRGAYSTREDHFMRNTSDRFGSRDQSSNQEHHSKYLNREVRYPEKLDKSRPTTPNTPNTGASVPQNNYPEEQLRDKSLAAIKEYYSAKDENEVALCIRDLNAPRFYPTVVSIWVNDSFERKNIERDLLAKVLVSLTKSRVGTFSTNQLIQGFESVLADLEDMVIDAPKAPEYLGRIFAKIVLENVLPLSDLGRLIQHGGEKPGKLIEAGLAAEVLGSLLEMIESEKGEATLNEIRASCTLHLEDFRPPHPIRCQKLEMFM